MNIIDLRKKLLQSSTTGQVFDRRKISYQFGSPEWLAFMTDNNLDCPAEDRRKIIRREEDREPSNEVVQSELLSVRY